MCLALTLQVSPILSNLLQAQTFTLGVATATEGPSTGTDSVVLAVSPSSGAWSAPPSASWLHTSQSGTGSANVIFTFDANPGATRTGTLTIGDQTLTVTQGGASFVAASQAAIISSGVFALSSAVDSSGTVYFPDYYGGNLKVFTPANGQTVNVITGLTNPTAMAVDSQGKVYVADDGPGVVYVWNPSTQIQSQLFSYGSVTQHAGPLAVDPSGMSIFCRIPRCTWPSGPVPRKRSIPLFSPRMRAMKQSWVWPWMRPGTSILAIRQIVASKSTTSRPGRPRSRCRVSQGTRGGSELGLVVDGADNIYFTNGTNTLFEWNVATQQLQTLESGLSYPQGLSSIFLATFTPVR